MKAFHVVLLLASIAAFFIAVVSAMEKNTLAGWLAGWLAGLVVLAVLWVAVRR